MNTRTLALTCALAVFCAVPSFGAPEPATKKTASSAARKVPSKPAAKKTVAAKPATRKSSAKKATPKQNPVVASIISMLSKVRAASTASFKTIKELYMPLQTDWAAKNLDALKDLLVNKTVVPLPQDHLKYNILPRLIGPHRIGQADKPENLPYYTTLRPFAMGALLYIGAQVKSGPVDITSMARHDEYQTKISGRNRNARTSFPSHTLQIAFDIGLANTSKDTAQEIMRILDNLRQAGKIEYVGERSSQVCFHVVPRPEAQTEFEEFYWRAVVGTPSVTVVATTDSAFKDQ